jgi:hypothetical protein
MIGGMEGSTGVPPIPSAASGEREIGIHRVEGE